MKLFPECVRDAVFWRSYNRLRDGYVHSLQEDLAKAQTRIEALELARSIDHAVNESLGSRLAQAHQTITDLEATLELSGFRLEEQAPLPWNGALKRVAVARFGQPSTGPSEWRQGCRRD